MNEATVTISIADAQTACHGMMTSQSLSAAQATQTVARVQQAIQAAAEAAAAKPKQNTGKK